MELLEQGQKIKLGVSGAAETGHCGIDAYEKGMELGRQIAAHGAILLTGATTGFPMWSAMGIKEANGISIGVSPASSEKEHVEIYNLPLEYMDLILYTGFGFPGRDIIFTHSTDGMLFGCGRIGTVHEFTVAFEDGKPMGILEGSWETDEVIKQILDNGHRSSENIVFDSDPGRLVEKVIELVKKERASRMPTHTPVIAQAPQEIG
ncbi:hypothetical protein A2419_01610 [Candidatus Adlerbacteria bacterium RIFOXYC1_FULL_48_26]|uniref:Protein containing YHS domain protein n=1 Tax=Candidatus Adlerbacteria bacterium RIFOXYC1_FULL_48_26 TaxID=1797247 RepID=A0A1F4Y2Z0_9BACT|nr:MAG: hypothetical protein A2419_01610 [Candidatus Adlerbacteria bacterium RIFOXYC1_FULL_48_26]OGC93659.1 MAG: hypothetical protein A2389_03350 [Candidatus Adlerbacteria bacterium RIFOXYB1_FULL_48_10]OGC95538.1 MAG: hypothetical protein A2590_01270 [Candidatus Adlerbacteria bacterium RIFOXYD1_FULL_48_8]